jgi:hypothetical protein
MRLIIVSILGFIIYIFSPTKTVAQIQITDLVIYQSFYKAGSTAMIRNAFLTASKNVINKKNVNSNNHFETEFGTILSNSKKKKHFQQKISNIDFAGEFLIGDSVKHYFVICRPNRIIDFTTRSEYWITNQSLLEKVNSWLETLN